MKTNSLLVGLLLMLCVQSTRAQIAVTYIPVQSLLGLSSNTEKALWADFKLQTNSFVSNLNMEFSAKWNFSRKKPVNYYAGPGWSMNPAYAFVDLPVINGYFVDFGARIKPFGRVKNLQVVFEISPYVNATLNGGNLRTRLGIAWNFSKKDTAK